MSETADPAKSTDASNPTDSEYIQWRKRMGHDNLPREDIIGIAINAYINENKGRLWNLTEPTDAEVVNWMFNNRDVLNTINDELKLETFIEILDAEIAYLDDVHSRAKELDKNKRFFTKEQAITMKTNLERKLLQHPPPPHIPPVPNLLDLYYKGPTAKGGYRRRNKRSKKQSKKSKKSRRSKKSKKSRKSKTSRRR